MGSSSEAFILAIQIHSPFISTHTPPPLITYISSVVNLSIIFVFKIFSKVKKSRHIYITYLTKNELLC